MYCLLDAVSRIFDITEAARFDSDFRRGPTEMGENMAKDEFVPIPGPRLLEAIGVISVKWSALEFMVDNILLWASAVDDAQTAELLRRGSVSQRWGRLRELLQSDYKDSPGSSGMVQLVNLALSLKGERDALVHGLYADRETNPSPEAVIAIVMKAHEMKREWPVTRVRILETAKKLDQLVARIVNHQMDFGERLGNSIRPNAWRHQSRKDADG
jgi:hypothetical protein